MRRDIPAPWLKLMAQKRLTSIRRLADAAGISHPVVARIMHGEGTPNDASIVAVAKALGVDPSRIYELAHMAAPKEAGPYEPPEEAARLTTRQREALTEIIRAMVEPAAEPPAAPDTTDAYRLAARHGMDEDRKKR